MCALSQARTGMLVCVLSRRRELACLCVCSLADANWHACMCALSQARTGMLCICALSQARTTTALYVCCLAGANWHANVRARSRAAAATACLRPSTPTYENTFLASAYCYICVLLLLYTATYVFSCCSICVLCLSLRRELEWSSLHMCSLTALYCYICVFLLLYMCARSLSGANSNGLRVLARTATAVVERPPRMLLGHKLLANQALSD